MTALSLTLAGCGGGSSAAPGASTTTTSTTVPSTTETTPTTTEDPVPTLTTEPPTPSDAVGGAADDVNVEEVQLFLASAEDDGPFYMVNLVRYRERAVYADGRSSELTGREASDVYGEWMRTEMLPSIGAEIVYAADVEDELVAGVTFDTVAVVRYPSRAAFAAMSQDLEFQEMVEHKHAGVADTIVLATRLLPTPALPPIEDPPHPATDDDPPFAFVHVLDYRDTARYQPGDADADDTRSGRDAVATYSNNAGIVAAPLGVRPVAWFTVEATMIGPVDTWEEVRINAFPSHATFDALTSNPIWQSGTHHRTAGLEATYAIQTLPIVNTFD